MMAKGLFSPPNTWADGRWMISTSSIIFHYGSSSFITVPRLFPNPTPNTPIPPTKPPTYPGRLLPRPVRGRLDPRETVLPGGEHLVCVLDNG